MQFCYRMDAFVNLQQLTAGNCMLQEGTEQQEYRNTSICPYCLFQGICYWVFLCIVTIMDKCILSQLQSMKSKH